MKPTAPSPQPAYEMSDASPKVVAVTGAVLAAGLIFAMVVAALFYTSRSRPPIREVDGIRQSLFQNGPNYRSSIEIEWADLRADTDPHLNDYGWIDREKGLVRIPVRKAMELLASEAGSLATPGNTSPTVPAPGPPPTPLDPGAFKENMP